MNQKQGEEAKKSFGKLCRQAGSEPTNIPKDQEWYCSKQRQKWEKDADNNIASGCVRTFNNVNDFIESLDA